MALEAEFVLYLDPPLPLPVAAVDRLEQITGASLAATAGVTLGECAPLLTPCHTCDGDDHSVCVCGVRRIFFGPDKLMVVSPYERLQSASVQVVCVSVFVL